MSFVILGAGGHGRVVAECAHSAGLHVLGYIDDNQPFIGKSFIGLTVLGTSEQLEENALSDSGVILGIGCNQTRRRLAVHHLGRSRSLPVVQHARSWVTVLQQPVAQARSSWPMLRFKRLVASG